MKPAAVLALALVVASCGGTPARVSGMDAAAIQGVSDDELCFTYVWNQTKRQVALNVEAEVRRRGLSCEYRKETMLSDCSMLHVLDWGPHPIYRNTTVVTVQNRSNKRKTFSVGLGNIASSPFQIAPGRTQSYGVVVSRAMADAAVGAGAVQGLEPEPPTLYRCRTKY